MGSEGQEITTVTIVGFYMGYSLNSLKGVI